MKRHRSIVATLALPANRRAGAPRATRAAPPVHLPAGGPRFARVVPTLALLAALCAAAPGPALAGAPLLGGYGGPGAGAQTILGAGLVNGPGGGSGGSGGGPTGGGSAGAAAGSGSGLTGAARTSGAASTAVGASPGAGNNRASARGPRARRGSTTAAGAAPGTHPRAAGANPNDSAHLEGSAAVDMSDVASSWFSGSDLLALVLATGALALVALATVRLTRTEHH
jgi:hypothetical protein